jgi:hypothetical protein
MFGFASSTARFAIELADNIYIIALSNIVAIITVLIVSWRVIKLISRFVSIVSARLTGKFSEERERLVQIAKAAIDTPGFFTAFAAIRTVVVTASSFIVTLLFNVTNIIGQMANPSEGLTLLRVFVLVICLGLALIIVFRLMEVYLVSKMVVRLGGKKSA